MLATALEDGIPAGVLSATEKGAPVDSDASWLRRLQKLIGHTLIALAAGLWAAVTPLDFETALLQVVEASKPITGESTSIICNGLTLVRTSHVMSVCCPSDRVTDRFATAILSVRTPTL